MKTISKEQAVKKDLWLIFIVGAIATLAAALLAGVREDDRVLRDAVLLGSVIVVATGSVLAAGDRLLTAVSKHW